VLSSLEKLIGIENAEESLCEVVRGEDRRSGGIRFPPKDQIKGTEAAALIAGQLRLQLGEALGVIDKSQWKFLWLTGFFLSSNGANPTKTWVSAQHPFTWHR